MSGSLVPLISGHESSTQLLFLLADYAAGVGGEEAGNKGVNSLHPRPYLLVVFTADFGCVCFGTEI